MFPVYKHAAPPAHPVITDYINSGTSIQSPADVSPHAEPMPLGTGRLLGKSMTSLSNEGEQKEIAALSIRVLGGS